MFGWPRGHERIEEKGKKEFEEKHVGVGGGPDEADEADEEEGLDNLEQCEEELTEDNQSAEAPGAGGERNELECGGDDTLEQALQTKGNSELGHNGSDTSV